MSKQAFKHHSLDVYPGCVPKLTVQCLHHPNLISDPFVTVYIDTMLWFFLIRLNCYFNLYFWGLMNYIYNQHFSCIIHHLGWILFAELITVHYGIVFSVKDTCDATLVQTKISNYISCQKHVFNDIKCCLRRQLSRF